MKRFIDDNGTFEIKIPVTWKYSLINGKIHTFQEYEIWKFDSFQISIRKVKDEDEKNKFLAISKSLVATRIGDVDYFSYPDAIEKEFTTKIWTKLYDDKIVIFTLTHQNNPDKDLDNKTIEEKIAIALSSIAEFRLIDGAQSASVINSYRFDMFLQGVGASSLILSKAVENKAFIESTCLLANQIDALLRIGIILKNQIINNNREIETEWIYQGLLDKKKSEKDIYKKSLDLGIIDQAFFDELYKLYDDRNRVIHRFIISEITLAEVEDIAYKYYVKTEDLNTTIYNLEAEQIKLNVGMTTIDDGKTEINHLDYIKGKIGKLNYFDNKEDEKANPS
ncbi:MAG: hypothetical protein JWO44_196 [Bacteroidetes bacterium]|nr:hypothetical protein [Bacteroidota bacterium]